MGVRGEVFSTKVQLQNRTYFFNVKENRLGDLYLNIVESKNRDEGGFERQSVILFADDLQQFLQGFDDALRVLEKAEREKRRSTPNRGPRPNNDLPPGRCARPNKDLPPGRSARPNKDLPPGRSARPNRDFPPDRSARSASGSTESRGRGRWPDDRAGETNRSRRSVNSGANGAMRGEKPRARHSETRPASSRYTEPRKDNRKRKDSDYPKPGPQKKRVVVRKRRDDD